MAVVVSQAVLLGDYWTAIKAAAATPSHAKQASNLEIVVECAIEDGLYSMAAEAASRVSGHSAQSRLMIMALEAKESAIREQSSPGTVPKERPSGGDMLCLAKDAP